jgi:flagellin
MRELAIQSANDTNSANDRASLQAEVNQLKSEMSRIAQTTEFNGKKLLDGTMTSAQFQVGANANETISFGIRSALAANLGNNSLMSTNSTANFAIEAATSAATGSSANDVMAQTLTVVGGRGSNTASVATGDSANVIAGKINAIAADTGVTATAVTTATLSNLNTNGSLSFNLQGTNVGTVSINATVLSNDLTNLVSAVNSQSGNTGITATISPDKASVILEQSSGYDIKISDFSHSAGAATIQLAGSAGTPVTLTEAGLAGDLDSSTVGGELTFNSSEGFNVTSDIADTAGSLFQSVANGANVSTLYSIDQIDISTVQGASNAIKSVDGALTQIDNMRGDLGAVQNRFESTIANLNNVSENLSAARSRILDADIAQETSSMTKNNILQQAGVSILAQANTTPQLALQLLKG